MPRVLLMTILTVCMAGMTWAPAGLTQQLPDRPLTLEDCIAVAFAYNPQITASEQGLISARAGLTRARSSYYPQLSVGAVEGLTSTTSQGTDTRQDMDLTLRQTLWQAGRKESIEQSRASLRATEFGHESTLQSLVEQVAQRYYGALAARELVEVAEAGVGSAEGHLEQVKARVKLGVAAETDVLPVEDDLARAELDLIDAQGAVRLALARLKNTMGVPAQVTVELAQASPPGPQEPLSLDEALAAGLSNRPEVQAGEASLRASRYSLKQAEIRGGPVLDLAGRYNQGYTEWEAREPSWNVLMSVSWSLFDGHASKADETSARAGLKRSEADFQRLVKQVVLEVESVLVEVERAQERLGATAKSVAVAEARLAAAEARYQQGVGILLEVIDARASVTNARASQVRAGYDYHIALVGLQRAIGTLAVPEGPLPESEMPASD